ncbi:hypothetical protein NQ315_013565 [Exocentrus adspersus]|uniref:EGF-like domain-containing protein n=1 Tax=Exocentrus adspersus TaxID=1586481 RepID=A0AAV8VB13_9CUCU|nr:hypothetical protein NQ315_013565 [Exocentrus adspersus]
MNQTYYQELIVDTYAFPGCLLDGVPRPPDVPPRNPTMSRLNGRLASAPSADPAQDFEPSCLVRTPSGNVYIPSGTLNHQKNSTIDYKSNSSCSSPSKDMKTADRCGSGMPYGPQVPVLPVRNNLRRPNSSHFPQASRFHFRKGLASKCTWKCTAIAFITLSVVLTAALSYISASSLLNWSYQNTKPCEVLVGENTQIVPASKTVLSSETNLSTSTKPKPTNSGGNEPIYSRKRRQISDTPHAFMLPNATTNSSDLPSTGGPDSLHASTVRPLHDLNNLTSGKLSVFDVFALPTNTNTQTIYTEIISTTSADLDTTTQVKKSFTQDAKSSYDISEDDNISDSSLFTLDDEVYDEIERDHNTKMIHNSAELQHDSPVLTDDQNEIDIVKLNHETLSTTQKTKAKYDTKIVKSEAKAQDNSKELTDSNLSMLPVDNQDLNLKTIHFNNPKFLHNTTNSTFSEEFDTNNAPHQNSKIKIIDVPPIHTSNLSPSKRVLVNVTIATDPDHNNPHSTQSVYVLSVSVPTEGNDEPGVKIDKKQNPKEFYESTKDSDKPLTTLPPPFDFNNSGGTCECSCPCLDTSNEFSESNGTQDYDYSETFIAQSSNVTREDKKQQTTETTIGNSISTSTEFTSDTSPLSTTMSTNSMETSEMWQTNCPEATTKLPPPPTILILEGARTFPAQSFPPDGTTFSQISLGQRLSKELPPYGYWNMQFYQSEAAYVQFDYSIPRGASIGVYARRNALPTHTQYHILEVLSGFKARTTRASHQSTVKKEVTHYMEQGHWFLSLYNDDGDPQEVTFVAAIADDMTHNCPNGCSGKGECLMGHCQCNPGFGGDDCSETNGGEYINGECQCNPGWKGKECQLRHDECEVPDCNGHGHCANGKCNCIRGYKGKFCEEGCPNSCSSHGQCRFNSESMWECRCDVGWDGPDCSILLEQNCNDGRDNDKDGLVDCEDPECCSNHVCRSGQLCVSSPKPIDVLLRKQPPAITASFFERMKFLIDEGSLQNYAKQDTFNESRSAVVRGRIVTQLGTGLMGVRVSTSTPLEGFTLTRDDGWFDLLVNGGGTVTLQFGRSPFAPQSRIVFVPWNEVVIIDNVIMTTGEERLVNMLPQPCSSHDYDTMKPVVLATWKHGFQGACPDKSAILAESQVVQESLRIPGTGLNLVYHSSRAAGYLSTIQLQLTPDVIPSDLKLIHLRITIEGILFEKVFEADPMIKFTYAWSRLNVYRQRVYGVTNAIVKVGYEYTNCKDIIWDVQTTKLSGHDMSISEVGGWNLDIHHRYNFHEDCEGQASKQRLLAPVALASAPDGSLFVGDFNLVRKIQTDGIVRTIVRLNATRVSYRYHMARSPLDGTLYISDPESHQIIKVRNTDDYTNPDHNWETVVGSGERCLPGDEAHCGDGALARDAKLAYPKGVAVSNDNILYFADGTNIRMVDRDGIVTTVIGNHMHKSHWKPLPCEGTLNIEEVHLRWPTELAINPLDNTLHIIDDHMILQLTLDGRIKIIAGRPLHCPSPLTGYDIELATHATLVMPQSISFSASGDLYVAESDSQRINRVRIIGTDGKISPYAGAESKCNCLERGCDCFEADHFLASNTNHVNSIENTKGQKCRLRMTRVKMLHELSTPDNYNVTFDYHTNGLLRTKLDSSGRSYVYNYDEFGRLTSAVTPTGKVISLSFDLSLKGATVQVSHNNKKPLSMLIKGSSVSTKIEEIENRIILLADGSAASISPWSHSITTDTVPYSILSEKEPLLGESYPVPAKQRTEIGGDLANRFEWRYFVRPNSNTKGSKSLIPRPVTKVGRKLRVNGENLLTMEYDRESASISVFMDDKVELLNVTYDRSARPVKWGPRNGIFAEVELEYDRFSRLSSWKWGELSESYGFDRAGRLNEIKYADGSSLVYTFKDMFSSLPLKVSTPRGSDYLLQYDDSGALQSLTTPRGHIHTFSLQTSLGFFKYQYFSPMNRHPYEIIYNDDGQILAKICPHQSGRVSYVYDDAGKLETTLAGMSSIRYIYHDILDLVKTIEIIEPNFDLRQEFKYHAGILKDEKLKFNSKSGLDNAHYKYQYDGNARLSGIDVDINGKELPQLRLKYNQNLGTLEGISDLRIYRNTFNRSVMQDTTKQFFTITDYDDHARIKTILINIKSFDVFRLEVEYDSRNRIKMQKLLVGRTQFMDRIAYNSDGHVLEVVGTSNWKYVYDENGNIIAVIRDKEKISLGYDSGDRVVQYGDVEFNSYDSRGFVVRRGEQKYRYNSRGQLIHAFERDKFQTWYYYDDRGRMIAWNDEKGNVTQYFYTNPSTPDLITHVHFPKSGRTFRFLYDSRNVIITVETSEQRFYVASDQNGSPLALFDINGNLIKEIRRTPFGNIILDTNPDFYLPVDFHGGILDPNTKLIYINKRLYDPAVGQWMTPNWEKLATKLTTPTDVFIYRFHNNDPINSKLSINYMTNLKSWLQMYGYDIDRMLGSQYISKLVYRPQAVVTAPQLAPDFGIMSGLQCIIDKINEKFMDLSFVPRPLLKMEPKTRNLLPRVAYRRSVFGEGVLISRVGGRALVSVVEGVNGVVQDVVTSVFNNSFFLNVQFSVHDQYVFYFVKDNVLKIRDDLEELRRLGGMFNVSTHEITDHGSTATIKELRLHNPDAVVIIKYGADPNLETHKILRHAHKRAVERAWEIEKQLVAAGFQGRGDWSEEEKEELISHGDVDGYEGVDIHSIHKYPQLADDPGNVAFQRDTKRKRRKSGVRRTRIHRHES